MKGMGKIYLCQYSRVNRACWRCDCDEIDACDDDGSCDA